MTRRRRKSGFGRLLLAGVLAGAGGCAWDRAELFGPPEEPAPAPGALVLRPEGLVQEKAQEKAGVPAKVQEKLTAAREAFRKEQYEKAADLFDDVADKKDNPPLVVQEALYYRAECYRLRGDYPKAADLYVDLLNKFAHSPYREQAVQHMYEIANYWLDDTREEMREDKERKEGKRWFVWPRFVSFDKTKPFLDREGRAVEKLEQVRLYDIKGPLADRALFLCGAVKLYNEDYREADHYFSQVHTDHPDSPLAAKAVELAIYCKHMSTGGSDYDGRKVAEARKLVQAAFHSYPELAKQKEKFLKEQMAGIDLQQAEKEYKIAEFYRRTGHEPSAYFYYEMVRRRFPTTEYARLAGQKMVELHDEVIKKGGKAPPLPPGLSGARGPAAGEQGSGSRGQESGLRRQGSGEKPSALPQPTPPAPPAATPAPAKPAPPARAEPAPEEANPPGLLPPLTPPPPPGR